MISSAALNEPLYVYASVESPSASGTKEYNLFLATYPSPLACEKSTVTIGNLGDIAQYTGHPDIFYKIIHPKTIAGRDIKSQARISGVLVYETEKLEAETTKKEIKDVDDVPEYRVQTHKDILNSCKEKLQLDQDTYDLCMRTIEIVDQAS